MSRREYRHSQRSKVSRKNISSARSQVTMRLTVHFDGSLRCCEGRYSELSLLEWATPTRIPHRHFTGFRPGARWIEVQVSFPGYNLCFCFILPTLFQFRRLAYVKGQWKMGCRVRSLINYPQASAGNELTPSAEMASPRCPPSRPDRHPAQVLTPLRSRVTSRYSGHVSRHATRVTCHVTLLRLTSRHSARDRTQVG